VEHRCGPTPETTLIGKLIVRRISSVSETGSRKVWHVLGLHNWRGVWKRGFLPSSSEKSTSASADMVQTYGWFRRTMNFHCCDWGVQFKDYTLLRLRCTVQRLYAVETKVYSSKIMLETEDHCFSAEAFQNCGTGNLKFCAPTGCHERTSFGGSEESLWVSKVGRKFWKKKIFVSFQNFKKIDLMISINRLNRLNRKNSQNRLNRFIGQRINTQQRLRYVPWAL